MNQLSACAHRPMTFPMTGVRDGPESLLLAPDVGKLPFHPDRKREEVACSISRWYLEAELIFWALDRLVFPCRNHDLSLQPKVAGYFA